MRNIKWTHFELLPVGGHTNPGNRQLASSTAPTIRRAMRQFEMHSIYLSKTHKIFLILAFMITRTGLVMGQEENLNVFDNWIKWTDGKNMLVHHLNEQAFAYLDTRDEKIAGLKTKEDWVNRQKEVQDILMKIVGPFPAKTPLNAKVTGVVKGPGYRIEKVIYESMPGFYVTACLFIPENIAGKKPAILFTSGHTIDAFRAESYQIMILNLVKKGFIVFAIDPIGQGERIQLYDATTNASAIGPMTKEHSYLGKQCFISGNSLAKYFIWDGIRAIDYLLTRNEVDPQRIGITGQSGGGTQAASIFAFDKRIKAGAPVNYITGFRRLLESIGPQDAEQNFYHEISNGITHADLIEVRAPSPALIVAGTRDFFSIQGARESYEEVRRAYTAFGAKDNIGMVDDDWGHGYTSKLREAVCAFFQTQLNVPGSPKDESITVVDPKELKITATGNVASSFKNAETVFSLNQKEAQKLVEKLQVLQTNQKQHLEEIQLKARELSGFITPHKAVTSTFRGRYQRDGYSVEMYALDGEGNCVVPLLLFIPKTGNQFKSVIYIRPEGKGKDASVGGKIEQLVKEGYVVAAPDVTGTGETSPALGNAPMLAMMINRSIIGIQAGDVIRVANFLKSQQYIDSSKIGAIAFDEMCPALLYAAAFDKTINSIALNGSPVSYQTMVMHKFYDISFFRDNTVPGALTAFDLPGLVGCIAPRKIVLAQLKDQMKKPASKELVDAQLLFPRSIYADKSSTKNLNIITDEEDISSVINWCFGQ